MISAAKQRLDIADSWNLRATTTSYRPVSFIGTSKDHFNLGKLSGVICWLPLPCSREPDMLLEPSLHVAELRDHVKKPAESAKMSQRQKMLDFIKF